MAHSAKVNLREICETVDRQLPMLDEDSPSTERMQRSLARSALLADLYTEAENGNPISSRQIPEEGIEASEHLLAHSEKTFEE